MSMGNEKPKAFISKIRLILLLLVAALFVGAFYLASTRSSAPGSAPGGSANTDLILVSPTPFLNVATLTPIPTHAPTQISDAPEPTEDSDGPPVSLEDYERLFPGVFYKRQASSSPRPYVAHIVIVDLNRNGIGLMVTPEDGLGERTSSFLSEHGLQLAINGDGWLGDRRHDPIGYAAFKGEVYSEDSGEPIIYVTKNDEVKIGGNPPEKKVWYAVSGSHVLIKRGRLEEGIRTCEQPQAYCGNLAARTSVGISANNYLIIVVVEGSDSDSRAALTLQELAELHLELGSVDAIAMDGGGSSTLVVDTGNGPEILNNPSDGSERVVSNHLGIFVRNRGE